MSVYYDSRWTTIHSLDNGSKGQFETTECATECTSDYINLLYGRLEMEVVVHCEDTRYSQVHV